MSIFRVTILCIAVVEEIGVKNCKERDEFEGPEAVKVSRRAEINYLIWVAVIFSSWVSEIWLKVESKGTTEEGMVGIRDEGWTGRIAEEERNMLSKRKENSNRWMVS